MDTLFDLGSFVIQGINFLIVALVLRKFFFVPYMKYLAEETAKRLDLEKRIADSTSIVDDAQKEAESIRDKARQDSKSIAATIVDNAKEEALEMMKKATTDAETTRLKGMADIDLERKEMVNTLKSKVLDVAIRLNQKLFGTNDANVDFLKKNTPSIEI